MHPNKVSRLKGHPFTVLVCLGSIVLGFLLNLLLGLHVDALHILSSLRSLHICALLEWKWQQIKWCDRFQTVHHLKWAHLCGRVDGSIVCKLNMWQAIFPHLQILLDHCPRQHGKCAVHHLRLSISLWVTSC